jgi:hypothetical protein
LETGVKRNKEDNEMVNGRRKGSTQAAMKQFQVNLQIATTLVATITCDLKRCKIVRKDCQGKYS